MLAIPYDKLDPIDEVCKQLDENSYYVVVVALYSSNVTHKAILYTGYSTGGYRCILNYAYKEDDMREVRLKIISKIRNI